MPKKHGIQIEIQANLEAEHKMEAEKFAREFLAQYLNDGMVFKATNGGRRSWYRRGTLGRRLSAKSSLIFRRASKHRRIYQIVRLLDLKLVPHMVYDEIAQTFKTKDVRYKKRWRGDGQQFNPNKSCMCPKCSGQIVVSNKYGDIKTYVYATVGEIKG